MVQYKAFKIGLAETSSERLNSFLRQNTVVCVDKSFVEAGQEGSTQYFNGHIDEVRISDVVRY